MICDKCKEENRDYIHDSGTDETLCMECHAESLKKLSAAELIEIAAPASQEDLERGRCSDLCSQWRLGHMLSLEFPIDFRRSLWAIIQGDDVQWMTTLERALYLRKLNKSPKASQPQPVLKKKSVDAQINDIILGEINNTPSVIEGGIPDEDEVRGAVLAQKEQIIEKIKKIKGIKIVTVDDPYIHPHIIIAYHDDEGDCIYGVGLSDDMPYLVCDDIWTFSAEGLKKKED